jgi:hypothetical protein
VKTIADAAAGSSRSKVGRKGGTSGSYDDWTKKGRSSMSELIRALRNH